MDNTAGIAAWLQPENCNKARQRLVAGTIAVDTRPQPRLYPVLIQAVPLRAAELQFATTMGPDEAGMTGDCESKKERASKSRVSSTSPRIAMEMETTTERTTTG
jgi:hypothetical protein